MRKPLGHAAASAALALAATTTLFAGTASAAAPSSSPGSASDRCWEHYCHESGSGNDAHQGGLLELDLDNL